MKRPNEGLLGLNKVFFFITLIFLATLALLSFSLWQTTKNNELSGNRQLVESVLKLANDSIVSRDQIGIERVLRASHQDGRYFRLVLPGNFEITWPREPFNPVWETKPSYKSSLRVGEGQILAIEYWAPAASGWTRWTFLALAMSFLLAAASIVALVLHVRRWRQDVDLIENYLSGAREKPALGSFRFEFFHRLAAQIFERESERELLFASEKRSEGLRKLADLSAQVAHDIRSPLSALEVASGNIGQLPEDKRILIRSAVGRIRDIANNLSQKNHPQDPRAAGVEAASGDAAADETSAQLLSSLIDSLITEKRMQHRSQIDVDIDSSPEPSSYGLFAQVPPAEFKRVISNLVNNAVEALPGKGRVTVRLSADGDWIVLRVRDNGKGIPAEVLGRLGRRGESHDKPGGSGLGLYHAKTSIADWNGSIEIESEPDKGTTVTIRLPRARPPEWFVSALAIGPDATVVVLDDDTSIHQVWRGRFESACVKDRGIEILHFSTPGELRSWAKADVQTAKHATYLLDYELLGYQETGLTLAEEIGIGERTILVTSRFEEKGVLADATRLKARLIPKALAGFVPIWIAEAPAAERLDAVLIDDDPLARMTWKMSASRAGKNFRPYSTIAEFLRDAGGIARETPIYVDAELANGVNGAAESRRIKELGFKELYLATGHAADKFASFTHLRGVIGKEPPWGQRS